MTRVLVFTGDGKGKTTAALGMALRAVGHGMTVAIVQFVKCDATVGEVQALARLPGVSLVQCGRGFLPKGDGPALAEHRAAAEEGLRRAAAIVAEGQASLVILDEACLAVRRGLIAEQAVLDLLAAAPAEMCVVLTGRGATERIVAAADTATEMRELKHGLKTGVAAQRGVEW